MTISLDLETLDTKTLIEMKHKIEHILTERNKENAKTVTPNADLTIWVDGSFNPSTEEYAYGVVVLDGSSEQFYRKKFPANPEMSTMRNVAGEIEAARFAILTAIRSGAKSCHIVYDYQGIEMWATKKWKANKSGTKAYAELFDKYKDQCNFTFEHVKGHTGVEYNEYCDALAKSALGITYAKKYNDVVDAAIDN